MVYSPEELGRRPCRANWVMHIQYTETVTTKLAAPVTLVIVARKLHSTCGHKLATVAMGVSVVDADVALGGRGGMKDMVAVGTFGKAYVGSAVIMTHVIGKRGFVVQTAFADGAAENETAGRFLPMLIVHDVSCQRGCIWQNCIADTALKRGCWRR